MTTSIFPDGGLDNIPGVSPGDSVTAAYLTLHADCINAVEQTWLEQTWKNGVRLATVAPLAAYTPSGDILTAQANGALSVDSTAVAVNDRVLVLYEAVHNGIYVVTQTGGPSQPWILTRSTDMNVSAAVPGAIVPVREGLRLAGTVWSNTNQGAFTLNTTSMTWSPASMSAATNTPNAPPPATDPVITDRPGSFENFLYSARYNASANIYAARSFL